MKKIVAMAVCGTVFALAGCAASSDAGTQASTNAFSAKEQSRLADCQAEAAAHHITSIALEAFAVEYGNDDRGIAGVHVCIENRDGTNSRCGDTDASGDRPLTVAPCTDIRVTYAKDGYLGINQLARVETKSVPLGTRMVSLAQGRDTGTVLGLTLDVTKAQPFVTTWTSADDALSGVSVAMSGAAGTRWYMDADGNPSSGGSATSAYGIMGFFNAELGVVEMTATKPGKTCVPQFAVPGSAPNSAVVENLAGSIGEALFVCH
jgi:hypothetical protein